MFVPKTVNCELSTILNCLFYYIFHEGNAWRLLNIWTQIEFLDSIFIMIDYIDSSLI